MICLLSAVVKVPRNIDEEPEFRLAIDQLKEAGGEPAIAALGNVSSALALNDAEFEALRVWLRQHPADVAARPFPSGQLSPREAEVIRLLAGGKSNEATAGALSISERTVENHIFHILAKLNLESRTAAATWAVREGLV